MKNKILGLGLVLALVTAMIVPMTALANDTQGVTVNGTVTATDTPVITTSPIYTTTTEVDGTNESGATVYFIYNGGGPTTATVVDATHWKVTGLTLSTAGTNIISVTAQVGTKVNSAAALANVTAASVTLHVPTAFAFTNSPLQVGAGGNAGSATAGSVVSVAATGGWNISVADANQSTGTGKMMASSTALTDFIQVGMTAPSVGTAAGTIAAYSSALNSATGHGQADGTFVIPLYANQKVEASDAPGSYSITLNYTVTSSY